MLKSDINFVTGNTRYIDDIFLPGMLYMSVVRSQYARARLLSVKGGITAKDIGFLRMASVGEGASEDANSLMHPVLAWDYVNYVGQPIAAVFSDDPYRSLDLLESVDVEYEPMKPVVEPEEALKREPIHPSMKSNILAEHELGEKFDIKDAPIVLEDKFYNRRIVPNPIETRGVVASYDGDRLTVWTPTQSVVAIREGLCGVLNLPREKVRVIQTDTGGAFGVKSALYPEYVLASLIAMKEKRPVKWVETRREHLSGSRPGRGVIGRMKIFANRQGRVLGLDGEVIVDAGAYGGGAGEFSSRFIAYQITGPYDIKKVHMHALAVLTNKIIQGPYRGAGRPEAAFFMERMMDLLADEIKMDPADVRLANMSEEPLTSPLGLKIEAAKPFFTRALREMGYKKGEKAGLAFFVLVPAAMPGESAKISVRDSKVHVWLGGNQHGQRHDDIIVNILREELGLSSEEIVVHKGDTDELGEGVGTWGSRSAMMGGTALILTARKIREMVVKEHGKYNPDLLLSGNYEAMEFYHHDTPLNSFGANLIRARVDNLGHVEIEDCISYYDVGKALSRENVIGQVQGGCAQGIGQTLYEEVAFDEEGQLITASISDAGVPYASLLPRFKVLLAENPSELPSHAKGVGESPTIGVPPALARAIELDIGKRIRETPIRQEILLR